MNPWDVVIIGGGILGTSVSYWIGNQYEGRVAVLEKEQGVAVHTSRRNTGVVHRPFYLDPVKRRIFARCSEAAYGMWKSYARERGLPWEQVTTLEVATRPEDVKRIEKYYHWGIENGMGEDELEVLSAEDVRKLEPHVRGYGAIWSKTDTSVDYHAFTKSLRADAESEGVKFLTGVDVGSFKVDRDSLQILPRSGGEPIPARFLINCAGGSSLRIAHMLRLGTEYCDLKVEYLARPGIAGVRAQVIDRKGNFIKEAIELEGPHSYHITNYNSPGATGSPAFAAWLVNKLGRNDRLSHLGRRTIKGGLWDFRTISEQVG